MTDTPDMDSLDAPPDADRISALRDTAAAQGEAVGVTFPTSDGTRKRFVVSPRGTCVLLNDTREDSFIPSVEAATIAAALREQG